MTLKKLTIVVQETITTTHHISEEDGYTMPTGTEMTIGFVQGVKDDLCSVDHSGNTDSEISKCIVSTEFEDEE